MFPIFIVALHSQIGKSVDITQETDVSHWNLKN